MFLKQCPPPHGCSSSRRHGARVISSRERRGLESPHAYSRPQPAAREWHGGRPWRCARRPGRCRGEEYCGSSCCSRCRRRRRASHHLAFRERWHRDGRSARAGDGHPSGLAQLPECVSRRSSAERLCSCGGGGEGGWWTAPPVVGREELLAETCSLCLFSPPPTVWLLMGRGNRLGRVPTRAAPGQYAAAASPAEARQEASGAKLEVVKKKHSHCTRAARQPPTLLSGWGGGSAACSCWQRAAAPPGARSPAACFITSAHHGHSTPAAVACFSSPDPLLPRLPFAAASTGPDSLHAYLHSWLL